MGEREDRIKGVRGRRLGGEKVGGREGVGGDCIRMNHGTLFSTERVSLCYSTVVEKDQKLAEKDQILAEKDQELAEKDQKLAELRAELEELRRGIWRVETGGGIAELPGVTVGQEGKQDGQELAELLRVQRSLDWGEKRPTVGGGETVGGMKRWEDQEGGGKKGRWQEAAGDAWRGTDGGRFCRRAGRGHIVIVPGPKESDTDFIKRATGAGLTPTTIQKILRAADLGNTRGLGERIRGDVDAGEVMATAAGLVWG